MTDVGFLVAFAAGVLALLSPCSALLLPSFFAYAFSSKTALFGRTALFYVGLLVTLVPLGMGASAVSTVFYGHRQLLITVAGWFIIGLGVLQLLGGGFAAPFAARIQQATAGLTGGTGRLSTLALGAVYGLAGFCSGPVLGAILTMAATSPSPVGGGLLLAVYALGMAAPLFLLAALWERFGLGRRAVVRGRMLNVGPVQVHTTAVVSGLLFVVIGVLFLRFDGTAGITGALGLGDTTGLELGAQAWLVEHVPSMPLWSLPASVAVVAGLVAWRRHRRPSRLGHQVTSPRS